MLAAHTVNSLIFLLLQLEEVRRDHLGPGQLARVLCLFSTYKKIQNKELGRTDHVDHKPMFYIIEQCDISCMSKKCNYEGLK